MLSEFVFSETSPAAPGTVASSQVVSGSKGSPGILAGALDDFLAMSFVAQLVGATGGTLDVYVQYSPNAGTTWVDYVHFTQLAAGAGAVTYTANTGAPTTTTTAVGTGTAPALAAGTVTGGPWGDQMRLLMVAGAGTTAGATVTVRVVAQRPFMWVR